jgi:hypothetical protein
MSRAVAILIICGVFACGPVTEDVHEEPVSQQTAGLESASKKPGDVDTAAYYEWTNRSASTYGFQYFLINVPVNTVNLTVASFGGSASYYGADLYLAKNYKPTTTSYWARSTNYVSNDETISIDNPSPGLWWIGLYSNYAYSGVTVVALY